MLTSVHVVRAIVESGLQDLWLRTADICPGDIAPKTFHSSVVTSLIVGLPQEGGLRLFESNVSGHKVLVKDLWFGSSWVCVMKSDDVDHTSELRKEKRTKGEGYQEKIEKFHSVLKKHRPATLDLLRRETNHANLVVLSFENESEGGLAETVVSSRDEQNNFNVRLVIDKNWQGKVLVKTISCNLVYANHGALNLTTEESMRTSLQAFKQISRCPGVAMDASHAAKVLGMDSLPPENSCSWSADKQVCIEYGDCGQAEVHAKDCQRGIEIRGNKKRCSECASLRKSRYRYWDESSFAVSHTNMFLGSSEAAFAAFKAREKIKHRLFHDHYNEAFDALKEEENSKLFVDNKDSMTLAKSLESFLQKTLTEGVVDERSKELHILIASQVEALRRLKEGTLKGIRWDPRVLAFATLLNSVSSATYEAAKNVLILPSRRTMANERKKNRLEMGISSHNWSIFKKRLAAAATRSSKKVYSENFRRPDFAGQNFVLLVDGIHTKKGVAYSRSSGKVVGLDSLEDFERYENAEELFKSFAHGVLTPDISENGDDGDDGVSDAGDIGQTGNEKKAGVGGEAIVFYLRSLDFKFHHPIAVFNVGLLNDRRFAQMLCHVLRSCISNNVRVHVVVFDGCSAHRKAVDSLMVDADKNTYIRNIDGTKTWVMFDYVHLLKRFRNALFRPFMAKQGQEVSIEVLRLCYLDAMREVVRPDFRVGQNHLWPDNYMKMNVKMAAQVMSMSLAFALETWDKKKEYTELVKLLTLVNDWFDAWNSTMPITGEHDLMKMDKLNEFLVNWRVDAEKAKAVVDAQKKGKVDAEEKMKDKQGTERNEKESLKRKQHDYVEMARKQKRLKTRDPLPEFIPWQLWFDFRVSHASLHGFVKDSVGKEKQFDRCCGRLFCQDLLENLFSEIRGSGNMNPDIESLMNVTSIAATRRHLRESHADIFGRKGGNCA